MAVSMYGRERLRSNVPRRGGAGTSRTEPKEMGAGGPQRVAAWVDAQGGGRDGARPSRLSWRAPTSPGPFRAWTVPWVRTTSMRLARTATSGWMPTALRTRTSGRQNESRVKMGWFVSGGNTPTSRTSPTFSCTSSLTGLSGRIRIKGG